MTRNPRSTRAISNPALARRAALRLGAALALLAACPASTRPTPARRPTEPGTAPASPVMIGAPGLAEGEIPEGLTFAPDGAHVALATVANPSPPDGMPRTHDHTLWSVPDGRMVHRVEAASHPRGAFDARGGTYAAGRLPPTGCPPGAATCGAEVVVLDLRKGTTRARLRAGAFPLASVAVSPDGRWVAAGEDTLHPYTFGSGDPPRPAAIWLWDLARPGPPRRLGSHLERVALLAFSPRSPHLVAASRQAITTPPQGRKRSRLGRYDLGTGAETGIDHDLAPEALDFTPDGAALVRFASGAGDQDATGAGWWTLWPLAAWRGVAPDGRRAGDRCALPVECRYRPADPGCTARPGQCFQQDPTGGRSTFAPVVGHHVHVRTRQVVTGGADGIVRLWDTSTGALRRRFAGGVGPIRDVALSPAGDVVAVAGKRHHRVALHRLDARGVRRLDPAVPAVDAVEWSPDGRSLVGSIRPRLADREALTLASWDATTFAPGRTFPDDLRDVQAFAVGDRGTVVAAHRTTGGALRVVRVSPEGGVHPLASVPLGSCQRLPGNDPVTLLGRGRYLTTPCTGPERLWDLREGRPLDVKPLGPQEQVLWMAGRLVRLKGMTKEGYHPLSPIASDEDLGSFSVGWKERPASYHSGPGDLALRVEPDEKGKRWAQVIQLGLPRRHGHLGFPWPAPRAGARSARPGAAPVMDLAPDGQGVAVATPDGSVLVLDLQGTVLTRLPGEGGPVRHVRHSPDGRRLAVVRTDGSVWVHPQRRPRSGVIDAQGRFVFPLQEATVLLTRPDRGRPEADEYVPPNGIPATHPGGLILVRTARGVGALDGAGRVLIAPYWDAIEPLPGGWLRVTQRSVDPVTGRVGEARVGLHDAQGRALIPPRYAAVEPTGRALRVQALASCPPGRPCPPRWGLVDRAHRELLPAVYDGIRELSDHALVVRKGSAEGCVDLDGRWQVPLAPQRFDLEFGGESGIRLERAGKVGFVDARCRLVVPPRYDEATRMLPEGAAVFVGDLQGLVDGEGREILPPRRWPEGTVLEEPFGNGLWRIRREERPGRPWRRGLIDRRGRTVIPLIYSGLSPMQGGLIRAYLGGGCENNCWDGKFGFLSPTGRVILPFRFDLADPYQDGVALVREGRWVGLRDLAGQPIGQARYRSLTGFSEGYAGVADERGRWGVIDRRGRLVIRHRYDDFESFSAGEARVRLGQRWTVIDVRGREAVKGAYDLVGRLEAGYREVRTAKGRGVLDRRGAVVVPPEHCRVRRISVDLFLVQRASPCAPRAASRGKWGVIDGQGREVLPFTFDHVVGEAWGAPHRREATERLPPVWLGHGCQWTKDGCLGGTWRRLDLTGKRLGLATSDEPGREADRNPLSTIRRHDRYGLVDARGVELAPPRFTEVKLAPGGYAVVTSPP